MKNDLISRQEAIDAIKKCGEPFVRLFTSDFYVAVKAIENLPSAQRKGKWTLHKARVGKADEIYWFQCSVCGKVNITNNDNFCSSCGADLREGGKDERNTNDNTGN